MLKILSFPVHHISIGIFERIWKISQLREYLSLLDSHIKTVLTNFWKFLSKFWHNNLPKMDKKLKTWCQVSSYSSFSIHAFHFSFFCYKFSPSLKRENSNPDLQTCGKLGCDVKSFLMTFWKIITMEWRI